MVDEYLGAGDYAGAGNREAYLVAFENAVDRAHHSVITGKAPVGATLRLRKTFSTPTWSPENDFTDSLETSMVVRGKTFTWDVNPSTRPIVQSRLVKLLSSEPVRSETITGGPIAPLGTAEHEFTVTETGIDVMRIDLDWPTPDDLDLVVYRENADGTRIEVGSSGNLPGEKEHVTLANPEPATYVMEVVNYASATPGYTLEVGLYEGEEHQTARLGSTTRSRARRPGRCCRPSR